MDPDQPPLERLPLGARLGALLVDLVPAFGPVVVAATIGAIWFDRGSSGRTDLEPAAGVVVVLAGLWPLVYFGRTRTFGKTRVGAWVSGEGRRRWLRGLWAVLPTASFAWPFLAPVLAIDAVWTLFDRGRSLHDRLARTVIIREVRESPRIRELRLVGADARREFAVAALDWALEHGASGPGVEAIRRAIDAAPGDPYEAQAAWAWAANVAAHPLEERLTEDEMRDPDFVDPELERVFEDADAAEEEARARLFRPSA